jgi:hypothetical protein
MSKQGRDLFDVLRQTNPGEVVPYRELADRAPSVGVRMTLVPLPEGGMGWHPNDIGPWEVVSVEPIPDDALQVRVFVLRRG